MSASVYISGAWVTRADNASTMYPHDTYPSSATTGYPHGLAGDSRTPVTLTPYTGPSTITIDDTVIDSKSISDQIWIQANNVVIKNCLITMPPGTLANAVRVDGQNAVIMDTEMTCNGGLATAVGDSNFTLQRVNIHGFIDGVRANNNVYVFDSYIHDMFENTLLDTHNDCIQSVGGSNVICRHNTLDNSHAQTSCFLFGPNFDNINNVIVADNLLNGGGYTLYVNDDPTSGFNSTNVAVINNRFGRKYFPDCGFFGPTSIEAAMPLVQWGNVWDDTEEPLPILPG